MLAWQANFLVAIGAGVFDLLYNIFLEVRSIRRMMNEDRRIPNEIQTFDDD